MTQRKTRQRYRRHSRDFARAVSELMETRRLFSSTIASLPVENITPASIELAGSDSPTPESTSSPTAYITPARMRSAYGLGTYNASNVTFNGVQGDGSGQTIAIYEDGDEPTIKTDLTAFDAYFGLPDPPTFRVLDENGGTNLLSPGDEVETAIDVEWAHVMAPGASLVILEGDSIATAVETAKAMPAIAATSTTPYIPAVSVITISYTSTTAYYESDFATPSGHVGVTTLASAGDTPAELKYPSNDYEVVSVGGTSLSLSGSTYSSESVWYTTYTNGTVSGTGGGITPVSQPSYQNGVVSAWSTTYRTTPDVSIDGDPGTGVAIYDAYTYGTTNPWYEDEGGTSLSSPLMAGIIAVADQGRVAAGLTSMDGYTQTLPRLYTLATTNVASGKSISGNFHDITIGSNGNPAVAGYDLASGIGSPVANKLIPDLAGDDTITGRVFNDVNGNGVYDPGVDTVVSGKTVYLDYNNDGIQGNAVTEPTAVTDSSGIYTFTDQIGGATGTVRLAALPAGQLHSTTTATYTTAYEASQTVNIGFYTTNYVPVATPNVVTGTTTALSVTGTGPSSDASTFLFTWVATTVPTGAVPSFSANGTNAAQNNTVTFNQAGNYVFTLTISDQQGSTVISTVNVTVNQTLTAVSLTPTTLSLGDGLTNQFTATAIDQFNNPLSPEPTFTWSIDGGGVGSIGSTGLYSAPAAGPGSATVRATTGSFSATAAVTILFTTVTGTSGNDVIRLLRSGTSLLVYENNTSTPVYNVLYSTVGSLLIASGAGNDTVNVDFSGGTTPVPTGGLTYDGSSNTDTLIVTGTIAGDSANVTGTTVAFNNSIVNYANLESIIINGNGGADLLTQTAQPGNAATLVFNSTTSGGPSSTDTLNVSAGTYTFAAPATNAGIVPLSLAALTVGSNAIVSVPTAVAHGDRWVLTLGSLGVAGQLDLGGNDMLVHNGSSGAIFAALQTGFAGGAWNETGIASSAAHADTTHLRALGMAPGIAGGTFDKITTSATDVLVKFTYYGDATVNGAVDGSDYTKIDYGSFGTTTGWANGDFNYDGVVNGSDYTLIDNAFNSQGTVPLAIIAPASVKKSTFSSVPFITNCPDPQSDRQIKSIEAAMNTTSGDVIDRLNSRV